MHFHLTGYVEGESVMIVYRWGENQLDRLPELVEPGVRVESAQVLLGFDDETVLVLFGELSRGADDLIDKPGQINRLGIEFELAGFDLRKVQYLVDEAKEVGPGGIHTAQWARQLDAPWDTSATIHGYRRPC